MKTKSAKLTKAQLAVMAEIAKTGEFRCIGTYAPIVKLLEKGLVRISSESRYGNHTYVATETQEDT